MVIFMMYSLSMPLSSHMLTQVTEVSVQLTPLHNYHHVKRANSLAFRASFLTT